MSPFACLICLSSDLGAIDLSSEQEDLSLPTKTLGQFQSIVGIVSQMIAVGFNLSGRCKTQGVVTHSLDDVIFGRDVEYAGRSRFPDKDNCG